MNVKGFEGVISSMSRIMVNCVMSICVMSILLLVMSILLLVLSILLWVLSKGGAKEEKGDSKVKYYSTRAFGGEGFL